MNYQASINAQNIIDDFNLPVFSDKEIHEKYDQCLDECFPDLKIGGYDHQTSDVLKIIDPICYRCGFADWIDSENFQELQLTDKNGHMEVSYMTEHDHYELMERL